VHKGPVKPTTLSPFGVTGNSLNLVGTQEASFRLGHKQFRHLFYVCSLPSQAQGILGIDFMRKTKARLDLERLELTLGAYEHENTSYSAIGDVMPVAYTIFTGSSKPTPREGKEGRPRWLGQEVSRATK
jgi:hypothetical protein